MFFFETFFFLTGLLTQILSPDSWEEDEALVAKVKTGDQEAIVGLMNKYQDSLYKLCYFKLGRAAEAEDAAREAFVRTFQSIKTLNHGRTYFAYLKTTARNCCNDVISRMIREGSPLPEMETGNTAGEEASPSPEEMTEKKETIGLVRQALRDLEDEDREILVLKHYQELTFREIGIRLGISENTAKTVFYRMLAKLAHQLEPLRGFR
jgi:RNA polymerase sigma-70 factor (ECF subfamily)